MSTGEKAAKEIETVLRNRDYPRLRELLTDDFVDHGAPPEAPPGPDGYVQTMRWVTDVLGIDYQVDDIIAVGEQIALRATARGVSTAPAFGLPATGKPFAMATMHWYRAEGDRLAEHWGVMDQLGMLAQIGALPEPGPPPES